MHADNPVDWYPWGEEAFEKAKREDKPVFLSIGYSSCHWCHVMEEESFSDPEVAEVLNRVFVNVKVDREERPDVDRKYMTYCTLISRNCGWPLNVLLTPDGRPFGIFTYLPKPALISLALEVERLWKNDRERITRVAEQTESIFNSLKTFSPKAEPSFNVAQKVYGDLRDRYDPLYGGFGTAPKFPTVHNVLFLLHYHDLTGDGTALSMATHTLTSMRKGGIYDHVGFGFHRYSVDRGWKVPHFEKMLYDQAMLILGYAEGYARTGKDLFRRTVEETVTFLKDEMLSPEGAFYSAVDADFNGEEGGYYVWTYEELESLLKPEELALLRECYDVRPEGNYEGKNVLYAMECDEFERRISEFEPIRKKLLRARKRRGEPFKDTKVLTDWNGLTVAALSRAAFVLNRKEYADLAERTAEYVLNHLYGKGGLLHTDSVPATLEDYAYLIYGLLHLHYATGRESYLKWAFTLTDEAVDRLWGEERGAFVSDRVSDVADMYDGALPSGNSVMLYDLKVLKAIGGKYGDKVNALSGTLAGFAENVPSGASFSALALTSGPGYEVVVVGSSDPWEDEVVDVLRENPLPDAVYLFVSGEWSSHLPLSKDRDARDGRTTVYICKDKLCYRPVNTPDSLRTLIRKIARKI